MLEQLSEKFQKIVHDLRGYGKLTEENVAASLRDIRQALLAADVPFAIVRDFLDNIKAKALGQDVMASITPGQKMVKIVHDELVHLLGDAPAELRLSGRPCVIFMAGLQGSGKTTTAVKLARRLASGSKKVLLVSCDRSRPAAVEQLQQFAQSAGMAVFSDGSQDPVAVAKAAWDEARHTLADVLIVDTAGRLHVDEHMLEELRRMAAAVRPDHVLLVVDAMIGQESVKVAENFHRALGVTGFILTKLDGDARGGAALSLRSVTQKPVFFTGVGEKAADLEPFYPDRLASRILGMGDVISFVEMAQEALEEKQAKQWEAKARRSDIDLSDMLEQLQMIKKMGSMEKWIGMIPGANKIQGAAALSEKEMKKTEAILRSMTLAERTGPEILNGSRRERIALGSGSTVADVNRLLDRFRQMKKMMKNMGPLQKRMGRLAHKL